MNYKVVVNMLRVLPKIKKLGFKLGVFNKDSLTLDIQADNPDDACYFAYKLFCDCITEQSSSHETKNLLKELKDDFHVVSLTRQ